LLPRGDNRICQQPTREMAYDGCFEHHAGRGIRSCPIFPELRPILDEAFEIFGDVWRQK
jgi:hypothetical protein